MRSIRPMLSLIFVLLIVCRAGSIGLVTAGNYGVGIPDVFLSKYLTYRAQQLASANPEVMRVRLGYVKGLSRSFVAMTGEMAVNLESGKYDVTLNGLTTGQTYSVWLVDRAESDITPLVPDAVFRLGTILTTEPSARLTGTLGLNLPLGFTIDRVVVAPGVAWTADSLSAGTVNVFQKIFFRRLTLANESTGAIAFAETTQAPSLFALVPDLAAETEAARPAPAGMISSPPALGFATPLPQLAIPPPVGSPARSMPVDVLISEGATLFFEKTFNGNGRTCGTCHPASHNFTIDADFINTLPSTDPLFVAEFNPALAQLERPKLMRSFGLILENLDGLDDPTNKFVMRGVPHTLGLQVSLQRDLLLLTPPAEMTGWSGDGSPGTGSLREFAIGAVTQHFTRSLERVAGRDFTLPSEHQLDAMEAFQLSLGRDADFDLSKITFLDTNVDSGRSLFMNGTGDPFAGGTCVACHSNAGALSTGQNRNFNTNVEDVMHPARAIENFPRDGGFGRMPNLVDGTFGNGTFNTAPVVEAADTPPFFHNNVVSTLEGVVRFYSGPEFNNPTRPFIARFNFNQMQVDQIADFLRGMNTLQNIDVARRELEEILKLRNNPRPEVDTRLQTAFDDTQDAIRVLNEGGIFPSAVTRLISARSLMMQAQQSADSNQRRTFVQLAIAKLGEARNAVATTAP